MKLNKLLANYSISHTHPLNIKIHNICVPIISFNVVCYFRLIPIEVFSMANIFCILALIYYALLDKKLILPMFVTLSILNISSYYFCMLPNPLALNSLLFICAWIGQFYGHKVEGKKPSFLEDIQFLLIGPIWVMKKAKLI